MTDHQMSNTARDGAPPSVIGNTGLGTTAGARLALDVGACTLNRLPSFTDPRGKLLPLEKGRGLPFVPTRIFSVYDVDPQAIRGEHAHLACEQFLYVLGGSVAVVVDDGHRRAEVTLNHPTIGLHIPANIWGVQHRFTPGAVLMVAASMAYDPDDYVADYREFLRLTRGA